MICTATSPAFDPLPLDIAGVSLDIASVSLDIARLSAVWPNAMNLNRTNRRANFRRRSSDDDGLRHVRRHR
jgi:hypothetical protein